ncbi:MAG: hypothetical protein ACYC5S_07395 [Thiobacillus sp.]
MKPASLALAVLLGVTATVVAADNHSHHAAPEDRRAVLELSEPERAMVLEEMRLFLSGVEKITDALARDDMAAVAAEARQMGVKMTHDVPPALRGKLPQAFRQLGFTVHREFDALALDAENKKDPRHSLKQLSGALQKCVSCHASYQIRPQPLAAGH